MTELNVILSEKQIAKLAKGETIKVSIEDHDVNIRQSYAKDITAPLLAEDESMLKVFDTGLFRI